MDIKLKSIELNYFKKFQYTKIEFEGKNYNIYGDNETGKTTIVDAFMWCLFGKNSDGVDEKNFSVRPIKPNGELLRDVEISVIVELLVDEKLHEFKKIRKEKWTQKRGSTEKEFSGNENIYFHNSVPIQEKTYKSDILEIVKDEEIFKILTNINYFNKMDWKKRRDIIFKMIKDVSNEEVINANKELKELGKYITEHSIDDLIAIAKSKKTLANNELKSLPARIDELIKISANVEEINEEEVKALILKQKEDLQKYIAEKSNASNNEIKINLLEERSNLITKLTEMNGARKREADKILTDHQCMINNAKSNINALENKLNNIDAQINAVAKTRDYNKSNLENLNERREKLLLEYQEINSRVFMNDKCSLCGQALPENQLNEAMAKFNKMKAENLEVNIKAGKTIKEQKTEIENLINQQNTDITNLSSDFQRLSEETNRKKTELNSISCSSVGLPLETSDEIAIKELIKAKENEIEELNKNQNTSVYDEKIKHTETQIDILTKKIIQQEFKEQQSKRIEELQKEEKKQIEAFEENEKLHILCEKFIRTKANMLTNKINSLFGFVNWKLFEEQINGGINEVCVATVDGVPFEDLNNAKKINAGLNIIDVLQAFYDLKVPVFIDNAESITKIFAMECQVIKLYVDENEKELLVQEEEK